MTSGADEPEAGTAHPQADLAALRDVGQWVTEAGLLGLSEPDLLHGFCKRVRKAGLPITRGLVIIDTLHPVHEGRVFRWRSDVVGSETLEYGRSSQGGYTPESWSRSPFFHMLGQDLTTMRVAIRADEDYPFDSLVTLRDEKQTDYLAVINRFAEQSRIGEMDCIYSSWATDRPGGFDDGEVEALTRIAASLGLAVKSASLARIAETLVQTYLGRDAGRRVLDGHIERGIADRIEAVLWFSDLRGFTRMADDCEPDAIIPLLNDYAEAVISSVHEAGGDVLKLMGDGTLAIFAADAPETACGCALEAERLVRARIKALNETRRGAGLPVTGLYLGLHCGDVFYGNIGSSDRLDFTVVGPAVNEVSRIATLCRSAERDLLVSTAFHDAAKPEDRARFVSVGRYALRGVSRAQDLYTLDPDLTG